MIAMTCKQRYACAPDGGRNPKPYRANTRSVQGELSCGMSLSVKPEDIENARMCIERNKAQVHDVVPLAGQIKSHRDRFY